MCSKTQLHLLHPSHSLSELHLKNISNLKSWWQHSKIYISAPERQYVPNSHDFSGFLITRQSLETHHSTKKD